MGNSIGEKTSEVIKYFLQSGKASEQGYKPCINLMKLSERYGKAKLENACERILEIASVPSVRNISSFLKNGNTKNTEVKEKYPESHGITRGAAYFKRGGGNND